MRIALCAALLLAASSYLAAEPEKVEHRFIAADRSTGKVAIINTKGEVEWEYACKHDVHDLHVLPGGNLLVHTSPTKLVEVTPDKKVVWEYTSKPKEGYKGAVEVHAFQRLTDGITMIAESGNSRIIEVDAAGKIVKEIPLSVPLSDPHRDTRLVRKLENGHYLVCHEREGLVREYDGAGKVVWEYRLDLGGRREAPGHGPEGHGNAVYSAVRLANGNTVIGGGNNNRVVEIDRAGKIVWSVDQKDLPGITLAWVTMVQVLPNGNVVIGNCHAGPDNPQLIEVTRDKKVVWTFKDYKTFGNNLAASQILDVKGVAR
jgi:hypothetical protein